MQQNLLLAIIVALYYMFSTAMIKRIQSNPNTTEFIDLIMNLCMLDKPQENSQFKTDKWHGSEISCCFPLQNSVRKWRLRTTFTSPSGPNQVIDLRKNNPVVVGAGYGTIYSSLQDLKLLQVVSKFRRLTCDLNQPKEKGRYITSRRIYLQLLYKETTTIYRLEPGTDPMSL